MGWCMDGSRVVCLVAGGSGKYLITGGYAEVLKVWSGVGEGKLEQVVQRGSRAGVMRPQISGSYRKWHRISSSTSRNWVESWKRILLARAPEPPCRPQDDHRGRAHGCRRGGRWKVRGLLCPSAFACTDVLHL